MNTGMQDACNLAWKLALVPSPCRAGSLLDSYSAERSEVGREVLRNAGRLTMATLKGGVLQAMRNHAASLALGLAPVRRVMTNAMSELSIGYPDGPLTRADGRHRGGPAAGERAPVAAAGRLVGAGDRPRFALFAQADAGCAALIVRHGDLLEAPVRTPFAAGGIWLVRPDGYVAMTADAGDWAKVEDYLDWIAGTSFPPRAG